MITPGEQRLLLTYSGGIDSTYALWRMLRDGHRVVALHVDIENLWGRHVPEARAVIDVRAWLEERDLHAEWMSAGVAYGSAISARYTRTVEIARMVAGLALRRPELSDISTVVASGIKEDPKLQPDWVRSIHAGMEAAARRELRLLRLIRHLTKGAIMDDMPRDLLELAWYCDHPDGATPCRACSTCRHVMRAEHQRAGSAVGLLPVQYVSERPS